MLTNAQFTAIHNAFKTSAANESAPIKKAFSDCTSARWMVCTSRCHGIVTWYETDGDSAVKYYDDLPEDCR